MIIIRVAFTFAFLVLFPYSAFSQSINSADLYGRWEVIKVMEGGIDISDSQGQDANRWIRFNADNTFESDGIPFGEMQGDYKVDEENGRITLIKDDFNKTYSMWNIQFKGYDLVFSGFGKAARFEVYLNSGF